jgi:cytidine deaminase
MPDCERQPPDESIEESIEELLEAAKSVRKFAYARYSHFRVGSALRDDNGRVHVGCNVENAAYPQSSCAEANAIGAMVATGGKRIETLVVVGGRDAIETCPPCGGCRQRILEFSDAATRVVVVTAEGGVVRYAMEQLLPVSFRLQD